MPLEHRLSMYLLEAARQDLKPRIKGYSVSGTYFDREECPLLNECLLQRALFEDPLLCHELPIWLGTSIPTGRSHYQNYILCKTEYNFKISKIGLPFNSTGLLVRSWDNSKICTTYFTRFTLGCKCHYPDKHGRICQEGKII